MAAAWVTLIAAGPPRLLAETVPQYCQGVYPAGPARSFCITRITGYLAWVENLRLGTAVTPINAVKVGRIGRHFPNANLGAVRVGTAIRQQANNATSPCTAASPLQPDADVFYQLYNDVSLGFTMAGSISGSGTVPNWYWFFHETQHTEQCAAMGEYLEFADRYTGELFETVGKVKIDDMTAGDWQKFHHQAPLEIDAHETGVRLTNTLRYPVVGSFSSAGELTAGWYDALDGAWKNLFLDRQTTGTSWFRLVRLPLQFRANGAGRPFAADVSGDGRDDLVLYDADTRTFSARRLTAQPASGSFTVTSGPLFQGVSVAASGGTPLVGDVRGDGRAELIVVTVNSIWVAHNLADGSSESLLMGVPGDTPLLGDVDGDGDQDLVSYRPSTGQWFWRPWDSPVRFARSNPPPELPLDPRTTDVPAVGDLTGDGRADFAVYRGSTRTWHAMESDGTVIVTNLLEDRVQDTSAYGDGVAQYGVERFERALIEDWDRDGTGDFVLANCDLDRCAQQSTQPEVGSPRGDWFVRRANGEILE